MMSDDNITRVHAPEAPSADVPTVPRGGGQPITDDAVLQHDNDTPEGELIVTHTKTARAAEEGVSPYPHTSGSPGSSSAGMGDSGLAPDRPNRATLDDSVGEGVVDNQY